MLISDYYINRSLNILFSLKQYLEAFTKPCFLTTQKPTQVATTLFLTRNPAGRIKVLFLILTACKQTTDFPTQAT